MVPSHRTQVKYNYTDKTLYVQIQCQYCNKTYKPQGIKKHKASCKKHQQAVREQ
ncbi:hypothetical protein PAXRUDRAFT_156227 [Paxillus rubicundulus Ve08.2h10]|uniref:Uncharacterized protein n=1 Tax=Paxillus rubicundulus Ve08.2h10 TaxID=930991 RepID=A0A0D0DBC7_9AGAM|nr:hypothetical protein PAXRUDRAFT_156227 [Paxillus rubicundulus Ve08.2h10]